MSKLKKNKEGQVLMFPDTGEIVTFVDGKVISNLRTNALVLWASYIEQYGYNPENFQIMNLENNTKRLVRCGEEWKTTYE